MEIVIITLFFIELIKIVTNDELEGKILPAFAMLIGGILGFVDFAFIDGDIASNVLQAIAIGMVSGLGATGTHQIIKKEVK